MQMFFEGFTQTASKHRPEIADVFFKHLELQQENYSLMYAGNLFKPHASAYIRGMDGAAQMRFEINTSKDIDEIRELAEVFFSEDLTQRHEED